MEFYEKPVAAPVKEVPDENPKPANVYPIESLPKDLTEEKFARVKFQGEWYWISKDQEENKLVGGDYVVVDKKDVESLKSGEQSVPEKDVKKE